MAPGTSMASVLDNCDLIRGSSKTRSATTKRPTEIGRVKKMDYSPPEICNDCEKFFSARNPSTNPMAMVTRENPSRSSV